MSAAPQLDFDCFRGDEKAAKKKREPVTRVTCKCGHHQDEHANRRHTGACTTCAGQCKRFRPKSKPPVEQPAHLAPPNGAIVLERDDTKRAKTMGWATFSSPVQGVFGEADLEDLGRKGLLPPAWRATIYLAQLKTKSLNKSFFGADLTGAQVRQRYAWVSGYKKACRDRAASAIAQLGADVAALGRPASIIITRVSPGTLDAHDNLRGALKYVVDGIAEALGFNDAELADSASRAGSIPITYAQEKCPQKVCGVRIELTWRNA